MEWEFGNGLVDCALAVGTESSQTTEEHDISYDTEHFHDTVLVPLCMKVNINRSVTSFFRCPLFH